MNSFIGSKKICRFNHSGRNDRGATSLYAIVSLYLGIFVSFSSNQVRADLPDRQVLRDRLKLLWDSLDSLEIRCEEYVPNSKGDRDTDRYHVENHFCHKKENFWFCDILSISPSGIKKHIDQVRQNGLKRQQIRMFRDFPEEISDVDIKNQASTPFEYIEAKFSALWLFLPGGKTPYIYLDEGAQISKAEKYGPSCVMVNAVHRNQRIVLILDGDHDWLPLRIESGDGDSLAIHEVTKFVSDNNRWFPSEGNFTLPTPSGPVRKLFFVTKIRINRTMDESFFQLPALPAGVRISNDNTTNETITTVTYQGGQNSYEKRQLRFRDKETKKVTNNTIAREALPIIAESSPPKMPWSQLILGVSIGIILIAAGLYWRGR